MHQGSMSYPLIGTPYASSETAFSACFRQRLSPAWVTEVSCLKCTCTSTRLLRWLDFLLMSKHVVDGVFQEALAAAAAHYQHTGEEDVYPPGAHAIGHGGEGHEGDASQMGKRTSDWVQEGEEEQDEAKKARLDGDPGSACFRVHPPCYHACAMEMPGMQAHHIII